MKKNFCRILILTALAAGLGYYLFFRRPVARVYVKTPSLKNPLPGDAVKLEQWKTSDFIPLTNHDVVVSMVQNVKIASWTKRESADDSQETALRSSVVACLEQLATPTYKSYRFLHSQIPGEFHAGKSASTFIKYWEGQGTNFSSDPESKLQTMWNLIYDSKSTKYCHVISETAPDQLSITMIASATPQLETANHLRSVFKGMGVEAIDDSLKEAESAEDIVKTHTTVNMALVTAVCRYPDTETPSAICFSLYWSPKYNQWSLYRLDANYLKYYVMF